MKKLIFFLIVLSTQAVLSQWEPTKWKSDGYIFKIFSAENFVILERNSNSLAISNDYGKSFIKNISGLSNEIRINCIAVQDSVLFIATDTGLFSSSDNGYNWSSLIEEYEHDNWVDFIVAIDSNLFINIGYSGILLSTDKGVSWNEVNNGFYDSYIETFFSIGNNLIAITDDSQNFWVSTDLGKTWIEKTEKPEQYFQYNNYAINDSVLYFFSNTDFNDGFQYRFYYSSDLGTTWNTKPFSLDSSYNYLDFNFIGDRIIIGTKYNIYYSDDLGGTWLKSSLIENGDRGTYRLSVSDEIIYASSGTEFYYSSNAGEHWESRLNSLNYGYVNSIVLNEDKIHVCTSQTEFCTTFSDGFFVSSDNGNTWDRRGLEDITVNEMLVYDNRLFAGTNKGLFISMDDGITWKEQIFGPYYDDNIKKFIIKNDSILVFSTNNIYFSINKGSDWVKLTQKPPFEFNDYIYSGVIKDNIIILGLSGSVYISKDFGKTWDIKINGLPVPEVYSASLNVKAVLFDGDMITIGTAYGIFISHDLGETWVPKNNGIPLVNEKYYGIESLIQIKNNLIAMAFGDVYYSSDKGETWIDAKCEISGNAIAANNENIYVGSYCNYYMGNTAEIFKAKLADLGISDVIDDRIITDFKVTPNPARDYIEIRKPSEGFEPSEGSIVNIYNSFGELVISDVRHLGDVGHLKRIDISHLPVGIYFIQLGNYTEKFVIIRK